MSDEHDDDSLGAYWDTVRVVGPPREEPSGPPELGDRVEPNDLVIATSRERILVILKPNGELEYGPDYTPDEAAVTFWEAMGRRRLEMEERFLIINHMESVLVRVGRQDIVVEELRLAAQAEQEGTRRRRELELRSNNETRRLEMYAHQAIELGRGLARRPEVPTPPVPEQVPRSIREDENNDYQGRAGMPSEPGDEDRETMPDAPQSRPAPVMPLDIEPMMSNPPPVEMDDGADT